MRTCPGCQETKPVDAFSPKSTRCRVCEYAVVKAWRAKNRERFNAVQAATKRKNPEKERARQKAYYAKHAEQISAKGAAYRRENAEQERERSRASHRKHAEKRRPQRQAYYRQHAERLRQRAQAWQREHPEQYRESVRTWKRNNPDKRQAMLHIYRARKRHAAINDFTAAQWREMLDAYDHRCVYCGRKMERLSQDHITPLVFGGNHTRCNIVPACKSCNSKKGKGPPLVPVQPLLL